MSRQKKGMLVPKLQFPEFRSQELWKAKKMGELASIVRGGSPRPIESYLTNEKNGLNWLKIGDIHKEEKYILSTKEKVKESALGKTRKVSSGDFILSNSMSFGRPYILKISACIHDGWIAISDIKEQICKEYLYYSILSDASQKFFSASAAGSGVRNLNIEIVKSLYLPVPSLKEQQKIADCLSSLDDLIDAQAQKLELLKAHKKALMQQLFPAGGGQQPRLRFPEFRNLAPWETKKMGEVAEFVSEKISVDKILPEQYVSTENLLADFGGKAAEGRLPSTSSVTQFKSDDILVSNIRPYLKKVWLANSFGGASNDVLVIRANHHIGFKYLSAIIRSDFFIDYVMRSAKGVKMPRGEITAIKNYPVPCPADAEQQKIVNCLSSLDKLIESQSQQLEQHKTHKKALMQQLFPVGSAS